MIRTCELWFFTNSYHMSLSFAFALIFRDCAHESDCTTYSDLPRADSKLCDSDTHIDWLSLLLYFLERFYIQSLFGFHYRRMTVETGRTDGQFHQCSGKRCCLNSNRQCFISLLRLDALNQHTKPSWISFLNLSVRNVPVLHTYEVDFHTRTQCIELG